MTILTWLVICSVGVSSIFLCKNIDKLITDKFLLRLADRGYKINYQRIEVFDNLYNEYIYHPDSKYINIPFINLFVSSLFLCRNSMNFDNVFEELLSGRCIIPFNDDDVKNYASDPSIDNIALIHYESQLNNELNSMWDHKVLFNDGFISYNNGVIEDLGGQLSSLSQYEMGFILSHLLNYLLKNYDRSEIDNMSEIVIDESVLNLLNVERDKNKKDFNEMFKNLKGYNDSINYIIRLSFGNLFMDLRYDGFNLEICDISDLLYNLNDEVLSNIYSTIELMLFEGLLQDRMSIIDHIININIIDSINVEELSNELFVTNNKLVDELNLVKKVD